MKEVKVNLSPVILQRACGGGHYVLRRKNPATDKIEYGLGYEKLVSGQIAESHLTVISKAVFDAIRKEADSNSKKFVVKG